MSTEDIIKSINTLRKSKAYVTNAFITKPQLDAMLAEERTQVIQGDDILLLLEEEPDLVRVYFYAADITSLQQIKCLLPKCGKPIVADIVGKNPLAENLAKALIDKGFEQYSVFVRMTCGSPQMLDSADVSCVEYAKNNDIEEICRLLYSEFDPLFSHFPTQNEIAAAVDKREIIVVRREQQIAGFAYFEVISSRHVCLRYFVVNSKYRRQGIGKALLAHAFTNNNQGVIYTLWISTYNSTIELYKRLNFKQDAMVDYIMLYKGE